MTPHEQAEILGVAEGLDRFEMKRSSARLRALLAPVEDERPCPIQDHSGQTRAIPWGLAEILYPAYGSGQTLEELANRGGFERAELGLLAADCYISPDGRRPRLRRMPLLDLYDMARRGKPE